MLSIVTFFLTNRFNLTEFYFRNVESIPFFILYFYSKISLNGNKLFDSFAINLVLDQV